MYNMYVCAHGIIIRRCILFMCACMYRTTYVSSYIATFMILIDVHLVRTVTAENL
jgi:hypothetical protein